MRKPRLFMHKGKLRAKHRYPRKLKKALNKKWNKEANDYINSLIEKYGDTWDEHLIIGG